MPRPHRPAEKTVQAGEELGVPPLEVVLRQAVQGQPRAGPDVGGNVIRALGFARRVRVPVRLQLAEQYEKTSETKTFVRHLVEVGIVVERPVDHSPVVLRGREKANRPAPIEGRTCGLVDVNAAFSAHLASPAGTKARPSRSFSLGCNGYRDPVQARLDTPGGTERLIRYPGRPDHAKAKLFQCLPPSAGPRFTSPFSARPA